MPRVLISAVLFALVPVGCADSAPGPPPPPVLTADQAPPAESGSSAAKEAPVAGERRAYDGLSFLIPEGWQETPLSAAQQGFVTAKFTMPAAGADVGLTLSRSGGGVDANLDRWRGQVTGSVPEVVETISMAGHDATLIDLRGTIAGGFGREAISDGRMLGIIVPLPDQGYFLKLTGPADQVDAVEEDFRSFARSAATE